LRIRRAYIGRHVRCKQCDFEFRATSQDKPEQRPTEPEMEKPGAVARIQSLDEQDLLAARADFEQLHARQVQLEAAHQDLQQERELLLAEVNGLREEIRLARDQQSAHAKLAGDIAQKSAELEEAQVRCGSLEAKLERRGAALKHTRAGRAAVADQLKARDDELSAARAGQNRLESELQSAREKLKRLQLAGSERDQVFQIENGRLTAELGALQQEIKRTRELHRDELARTNAAYSDLDEKHLRLRDQHEAAERSCKLHQDRISELIEEQTKLKSDFESTLAREQLTKSQLLEELQKLRAESDRGASRAEASPPGDSSHLHAEIESARAQVDELKQRLVDLEEANREMAAVLGGMGILQSRRR
jgi:chromosome segregation ATPase